MDWFSIEIEPRDLEEVTIWEFDSRRKLTDVWMGFHARDEFEPAVVDPTIGGFPRDPEIEGPADPEAERDDDEWSFRDYGLSPRYLVPDEERWRPRMQVSRTDVDIAIEGNGDAAASVALVMEPLLPLAALRLNVSPFADVTDVRWRTDLPPDVDDATRVALLAPDRAPADLVADPDPDEDDPPGPDRPAPIAGEQVHYVQATHDRRFSEDLHDPWLTVLLPRPVAAGERFVLEIAYEAELIERLRDASGYLLKDTTSWIPRHPDNRRRRFDLTFRVPERFRIASGGELLDERVEDDTRIMRWVTNRAVRGTMSFHMGRFEVDEVTPDGLPPIAVYADRNHVGFAPGNREKTLDDLVGSLRTYIDYFGPYPFDSLLVTETRTTGGQAFPGLVLLTFHVFGGLHTGESELFRAHEVAHQWWGAGVDWESYRDQWITEGFANYSAALYVLAGLGEEDQFRDMLDAWRLDALGEVNVGQGYGKRYGFVPAVIRESDGNESGAAGGRLPAAHHRHPVRLPPAGLREGRLHPAHAPHAPDGPRYRRRPALPRPDARFRARPHGRGREHALVRGRCDRGVRGTDGLVLRSVGLRRRRADLPPGPRRVAAARRAGAVRAARHGAAGGRAAPVFERPSPSAWSSATTSRSSAGSGSIGRKWRWRSRFPPSRRASSSTTCTASSPACARSLRRRTAWTSGQARLGGRADPRATVVGPAAGRRDDRSGAGAPRPRWGTMDFPRRRHTDPATRIHHA